MTTTACPQTVTNNILYDGHANEVPGGSFSTGLLGSCNTGGVPSQVSGRALTSVHKSGLALPFLLFGVDCSSPISLPSSR